MKLLLSILTLVLLSACTGKTVLMRNDLGVVQKCAVSASSEMMTGAFMASRNIDNCVEQWQKVGYKKVD